MVCPCCGHNREIKSLECHSCGARQVGEPLAPPDHLLPQLGMPAIALSTAILICFAFLALWIFGNDMKVGRVMLVWALGDSTMLTKTLLETDPKLPLYRIFSFDAYKAAILISFGAIPLSLWGMWMARRARRLALAEPARFGGLRIAKLSFAATLFLFVTFASVALSSIPDAIERGRQKRIAATNAQFYEQAAALLKYRQEYGAYPSEMGDLSRINIEMKEQNDAWGNGLAYEPIPDGQIASRGAAISFSSYKLVSPGPDGKMGTADDITMIDGLIVESAPNTGSSTGYEKPRP